MSGKSNISETQDVVMEDVKDAPTTLQLSDLEAQILDLYDRMKELELEMALVNAQKASYDSKS